ncbi:hypothetical protein FKM82_029706 [Ascaphus truei]
MDPWILRSRRHLPASAWPANPGRVKLFLQVFPSVFSLQFPGGPSFVEIFSSGMTALSSWCTPSATPDTAAIQQI